MDIDVMLTLLYIFMTMNAAVSAVDQNEKKAETALEYNRRHHMVVSAADK